MPQVVECSALPPWVACNRQTSAPLNPRSWRPALAARTSSRQLTYSHTFTDSHSFAAGRGRSKLRSQEAVQTGCFKTICRRRCCHRQRCFIHAVNPAARPRPGRNAGLNTIKLLSIALSVRPSPDPPGPRSPSHPASLATPRSCDRLAIKVGHTHRHVIYHIVACRLIAVIGARRGETARSRDGAAVEGHWRAGRRCCLGRRRAAPGAAPGGAGRCPRS